MFQTTHLQEKWQPVLDHPDLPKINDAYRRAVTTVILENQEKALREDASFLAEGTPVNATAAGQHRNCGKQLRLLWLLDGHHNVRVRPTSDDSHCRRHRRARLARYVGSHCNDKLGSAICAPSALCAV